MHLFAQSPNNVVDEVIWVVGDEAILRSDVEAARMDSRTVGYTEIIFASGTVGQCGSRELPDFRQHGGTFE